MLPKTSESSALPRHFRAPRGGAAGHTGAFEARRPMLVEFLGIPGSGKTTLCSAVVAELCRAGFTVLTVQDYNNWTRQALRRKLAAILTSGPRTWYFFVLISYHLMSVCKSPLDVPLMKAIYDLTCMRAWLCSAVQRSQCSGVILDGFICHRLAFRLRNFPLAGSAASRLIRILFLFYPRCETHWLFKTVPVELVAQRISRRPMLNRRAPKPIETFPHLRQEALLHGHLRLLQFMFGAIELRSRENAHCIDGAQPIDVQVTDTSKLLVGLLSDRRPHSSAIAGSEQPEFCGVD